MGLNAIQPESRFTSVLASVHPKSDKITAQTNEALQKFAMLPSILTGNEALAWKFNLYGGKATESFLVSAMSVLYIHI